MHIIRFANYILYAPELKGKLKWDERRKRKTADGGGWLVVVGK